MDKRINRKVAQHFVNFKTELVSHLPSSISEDDKLKYLNFIYSFPAISIGKEDLQKRKRIKNHVPLHDKCRALRANGEQCGRRKKNGEKFCGTHIKGIPHGEISNKPPVKTHKTVSVWIQEIHGISYYIDKNNNVYNHNDIINNKINPKIIAKYTVNDKKEYSIPALFK